MIPARATTYNGIAMRSRLEARYAEWLDSRKLRWDYEPQCYASPAGQYLPDFIIHDIYVLGSPREIVVEVKPTLEAANELVLDRPVWEIVRTGLPDAWFIFEIPGHLPFVNAPPELGYGKFLTRWGWGWNDLGRPCLSPHMDRSKWDH